MESPVKRFVRMWYHKNDSGRPLPISQEVEKNGNFVFYLAGKKVGFAFGHAGRPTMCYWHKDLENEIRFPDASNQYVDQEKLELLISQRDSDSH